MVMHAEAETLWRRRSVPQQDVDRLATESRGRIALHDAAEGGHNAVLQTSA